MKVDKERYKVYTWENWMLLHWILNPGLVFNELILGQRIPKISLIDKTINKPLNERSLVPCPHCETLHDGRTWSSINGTAFKNWFGLYCKNCGNIIPCLINVFSFILLVVTFPIWGWFRKYLKAKWLAKQPKRFENIKLNYIVNPINTKILLKFGLGWAAFMFLIMSIGYPYLLGQEITKKMILFGIIIWPICGLLAAYFLKILLNKILTTKVKNPATNSA